MPRKPRCLVDGGYYHIMSRGHNKCQLFHSRKDYEKYKNLIIESKHTFGLVGNLFQGRYKGLIIDTNGYLLECGRYIERNPLKSGMEGDLSRYCFSSYSFYAKGEEDKTLTPNPLYLELSRSEEERRVLYKEYVIKERIEDHIRDSNSGRVWRI